MRDLRADGAACRGMRDRARGPRPVSCPGAPSLAPAWTGQAEPGQLRRAQQRRVRELRRVLGHRHQQRHGRLRARGLGGRLGARGGRDGLPRPLRHRRLQVQRVHRQHRRRHTRRLRRRRVLLLRRRRLAHGGAQRQYRPEHGLRQDHRGPRALPRDSGRHRRPVHLRRRQSRSLVLRGHRQLDRGRGLPRARRLRGVPLRVQLLPAPERQLLRVPRRRRAAAVPPVRRLHLHPLPGRAPDGLGAHPNQLDGGGRRGPP